MRFPINELLDWYDKNKRDLPWRHTRDIYKIWISEVMLQQTQVAAATPYFERFVRELPDIRSLAQADEEMVLKLWEGMGYYNRCRNLQRAARIVMEEFSGIIPQTPERFETLPGAGPYITAAVMSIAAGHPMPAVDGNVMRVCARFSGIEEDISRGNTKTLIAARLQTIIPKQRPGDFNQAMMELGALICLPQRPRCNDCPLHGDCDAYRTGRTGLLPVKAAKKKIPHYRVSVAVIRRGDSFFIQKRPASGHLGGMWEFPGGKSRGDESPEETLTRECREELGIDLSPLEELAVVNHAYSHFKITMSVFVCGAGEQAVRPLNSQSYQWITIADISRFPFPAANHKFFPRLRRYFASRKS